MRKTTTKTPLIENFSRAFDYYIILSGKTQKDIADYVKVSTGSVSSWRSGRHLPDMDTLQRLADYLGAPIEQFFQFTALEKANTRDLSEVTEILEKLSDEDIKIIQTVAERLSR